MRVMAYSAMAVAIGFAFVAMSSGAYDLGKFDAIQAHPAPPDAQASLPAPSVVSETVPTPSAAPEGQLARSLIAMGYNADCLKRGGIPQFCLVDARDYAERVLGK